MNDARYRLVLDALADAVIVAGTNERIVYANAAAEALFGWGAGELEDQPITVIMPPRMREAHQRAFYRYTETRSSRLLGRPIRVPALHKNGAELDVELTLSAPFTLDEQGVVIASIRDLRCRVDLERQLSLTRYLRAATIAAARMAERLDFQHVVDTAVTALVDGFDAALARVWLLEPDERHLCLYATRGLSNDVEHSSRERLDLDTCSYNLCEVARARRPFIKNGLRDDPAFEQDWVERERIAAVAMYPLMVAEELCGVLICFFRNPLEEEVIEALNTLASTLSSSLKDIRLFEREQSARAAARRAERRLHAQYRVASALSTSGSLEQAAPDVLAVLGEDMGWDIGVFWTFDRCAQLLRPIATWHQAAIPTSAFLDATAHAALAPGRGAPGAAWRDGTTHHAHDTHELEDPGRILGAAADRLTRGLAIPVRCHGRPVAVIELWARDPSAPDADLLRSLASIEAQIGRFAEQKRAEERQLFISQATSLLARSLELDVTLTTLANLAVPLLGDLCTIDLREGKATRQVAIAHHDPERREQICAMRKQSPPGLDEVHGVARVLRTGEPVLIPAIGEERFADGDERLARVVRAVGVGSLMMVPLSSYGRTFGVISFGLEGSERLYSEADLAVAEELAARAGLAIDNARLYAEAKEAIRGRDEFLTIASHELKTPLTSMLLAVQSTMRSIARAPKGAIEPERALGKLSIIERQGQRLSKLVNDLLDISRITGGRLVLDLDEVSLVELVREVIARFSGDIRKLGCEVHLCIDAEPMGLWDRSRLDQVITNLLSNAMKFGAGKPVEVRVEARDEHARLVVRDQGIGIAPGDKTRIFQRFERAVSSRHYGGFGMGLWIAREIIEAHGGSIRVESDMGKGSTFIVECPLRPAEARAPAASRE